MFLKAFVKRDIVPELHVHPAALEGKCAISGLQ